MSDIAFRLDVIRWELVTSSTNAFFTLRREYVLAEHRATANNFEHSARSARPSILGSCELAQR